MRPGIAVFALVLASTAVLVGQQDQAPLAAFDVVSIKPNPSGAGDGRIILTPGGRVEWPSTTLRRLLGLAYMRHAFDSREIVGGPSWISSESFTVVATAGRPILNRPDGFPAELFEMLRGLVEERFKVRVHNEQRDAAIHTLGFARDDHKLGRAIRSVPDSCAESTKATVNQPPRNGPPPCSFGGPPGKLVGTSVTLSMFVNVLSRYVGRPVMDRTALRGSFDLELTFDPASTAAGNPGAPPGPTPTDDTVPSIFTALQEQLGLKLESTRGLVDVLVIDSADLPTPN